MHCPGRHGPIHGSSHPTAAASKQQHLLLALAGGLDSCLLQKKSFLFQIALATHHRCCYRISACADPSWQTRKKGGSKMKISSRRVDEKVRKSEKDQERVLVRV